MAILRGRVTFLLVGLALVTSAGCGTDSGPETRAVSPLPAMPSIEEGIDMPPNNSAVLTDFYADPLAELGYSLATGTLRETATGTYNSAGTQLALYTIPLTAIDSDQYDQGVVNLAAALVPDAFNRWPAITAIDICQERPDNPDTGSVTQMSITREANETLDWTTVTLEQLQQLAKNPDSGVQLVLNNRP